MDKSFNDQELSDIMKEIEALEEDFSNEESPEAEANSEVMEELVGMAEEEAIPVQGHPSSVVPMKPSAQTYPSAKTSMSFKVSGELNLDLQFDIGGKVVSVCVTEAGLMIEMEGGVTFNVPVVSPTVAKKAS